MHPNARLAAGIASPPMVWIGAPCWLRCGRLDMLRFNAGMPSRSRSSRAPWNAGKVEHPQHNMPWIAKHRESRRRLSSVPGRLWSQPTALLEAPQSLLTCFKEAWPWVALARHPNWADDWWKRSELDTIVQATSKPALLHLLEANGLPRCGPVQLDS